MANTYFRVRNERTADGELTARYTAAPETAGPWDPRAQHGGPPNALAVHVAERLARSGDGSGDGSGGPPGDEPGDLVAARLGSEFTRPVPVGEVDVHAKIVRAARTAVLVSVRMASGGRDCLHSRVWLIRRRDTTAALDEAGSAPVAVPPPVPDGRAAFGWDFPYAHTVEWRPVAGRLHSPGPASVWARARMTVVDDEPLSGLQRVALIGDSSSGISSELDWDRWSFLNVDLDVHLARPVEGDWIHLDAATQLGAAGFALCRGAVADPAGPVATTAQTLLLVSRTP